MINSTLLKNVNVLVLVILVTVASGFKQQPPQLYQTTSGKISFRSDAPLEVIRASSGDLIGLLDIGKKNFAFKIDIHSFQGFNSPLQKEHFNENYMESDKYPTASFNGKIIEDVDLSVDGTYEVRAKGTLTIHNVPQERIIKSDVTVKKNVITINSDFTVLLSEHNIPIPKVVNQKLANEIKVEVNTILQPR
jgi:YceI-like domain